MFVPNYGLPATDMLNRSKPLNGSDQISLTSAKVIILYLYSANCHVANTTDYIQQLHVFYRTLDPNPKPDFYQNTTI